MLGQTTIGTFFMYGALVILLTLVVIVFLRTALMMSLLFLSPTATIVRQLMRILRIKPKAE